MTTSHAGTATPDTSVVAPLLGLTLVTGIVDAVSFLGLGGIFTANMTGNVVFLGFALGGGLHAPAWRSLTALAAFAVGNVCGGWLTNRAGRISLRSLTLAMGLESLLLAAGAMSTALVPSGSSAGLGLVIVLIAVAMGLRNAVVRKAAVPDLTTTTVLTGTITALMADSHVAGGDGERHGRRALSIVAMCAGAALGAQLLLRLGVAGSLMIAALIVFGLALSDRLMSPRPASRPA